MKLAVITDIHIGARSDSLLFCKHQLKFFNEIFIPYLKENNIDTIICMGDLFDRRKFTNHAILHEWKKEVFDRLTEFDFHLILGNHDIAYRNSLKVNSPSLFLNHYDNIILYDEPKEVVFDELKVLMCPWICLENEEQSKTLLRESKSKVVFGHFEINGFEMHRGQVATDGYERSIFERFDCVFSGHFHHRSSNGPIHYIGNPYDLSWADFNDYRGFAVFDTSTLEFEYIDNPFKVHSKFYYDDKNKGQDYYKGFDLNGLEDCFVKVVVVNKTDLYQFDQFLNRLYSIKLADLKIIEEFDDIAADQVSDEKIDLEDTMTLMDTYIDSIEIDGEKEKLKSLMKGLYLEASRL